jgi:hypothetical protein
MVQMLLSHKLDKLIDEHNLKPTSVERVISKTAEEIFENLEDVVGSDLDFDEYDGKSVLVRNIGLDEIRLPQRLNGVIVDDIQKSSDGNYIVNLTKV